MLYQVLSGKYLPSLILAFLYQSGFLRAGYYVNKYSITLSNPIALQIHKFLGC